MNTPQESNPPASPVSKPSAPGPSVELRRRETFRWPEPASKAEPAEPRELVERGYGWGV